MRCSEIHLYVYKHSRKRGKTSRERRHECAQRGKEDDDARCIYTAKEGEKSIRGVRSPVIKRLRHLFSRGSLFGH